MRFLNTLFVAATLLFTCGQVSAQETTYDAGHQPKSYSEAYRDAQAGDKPLLVLVSATWCPPCQVMKQTTIPQLIEKDAFKKFHYATVDLDQEEGLAKQLIGNRGLPQFIMFEKHDGKWVRRYLKGIQSVATVEAFVAQASTYRTADAGFEVIGK
jgi:thioredoxin-like negative regulator of GroEL